LNVSRSIEYPEIPGVTGYLFQLHDTASKIVGLELLASQNLSQIFENFLTLCAKIKNIDQVFH
jgi:hypothetical protein